MATELNLTSFEDALGSLEKALQRTHQDLLDKELRDACIQRFEYTFELAWKTLKRQIETEEGASEVDSYSKKTLFRVGVEKGLIKNALAWFNYLEKRNLTVHTYNEKNAEEVFSIIDGFYQDAIFLLEKLKTRND